MAALPFAAIPAAGQNLNPTVEVTNAYIGKTIDAHKPLQKMAVPDSLMKFDLDFDYSVLSSPYRGGYDFSPYLLDMKPGADPYRGHKLFVRLGGGYTLNPVVDLVYSPRLKNDALKINLYAFHRSYIGDYNYIGVVQDGTKSKLEKGEISSGEDTYSGHDMLTRAGFDGRYDWRRASLVFGGAYHGIHTKAFDSKSGYNSADIYAGIFSSPAAEREKYFFYDLSLKYRTASEDAKVTSYNTLKSNDFSFKASLGPVLDATRKVAVELGTDISTYSSLFSHQAGHFYVTPKYIHSSDKTNFQLGLKLDFAIGDKDPYNGQKMNNLSGHAVYPDVSFDARLIKDRLDFYAKATGGIDSNSYGSLKDGRHYFNSSYAKATVPFLQNTIEQINVSAGLRGNFAAKFKYDISAGYASYEGLPTDGVQYGPDYTAGIDADNKRVSGTSLLPYIVYNDTELFYARLKYAFDTDPVLVEGSVKAVSTKIYDDEKPGFAPAPFSGDIRVRYNWNRRIYLGVYAEAASQRKGYMTDPYMLWNDTFAVSMNSRIAGWVDLGAEAEYVFSNGLSLWVSARNLLNFDIQRTPLYCEKGIKFTAGICFSL